LNQDDDDLHFSSDDAAAAAYARKEGRKEAVAKRSEWEREREKANGFIAA
jgi:hypothetical protein